MRAETGVGPAIASGGLATGADQQQYADRGHDAGRRRRRAEIRVHVLEIERSGIGPDQERREQEARVADTVDDERLEPRRGLGRVLEPEADQQVGGEADALPADEQRDEVLAEDQHQHEEQEQVQVREVARVAGVAMHVADRVDMDQRADAGDHEAHHGGDGVEIERRVDREAAGGRPGEQGVLERTASAEELAEHGFWFRFAVRPARLAAPVQ